MKDKERLKIEGIVLDGTKDLEKFQNEVLRPILKTRHELLILNYQNHINSRKVQWNSISYEQQSSFIESSLTKDISYKNQLIGFVIGQFSIEEYHIYSLNSSEFNKRILQMLQQRLKNSRNEIA